MEGGKKQGGKPSPASLQKTGIKHVNMDKSLKQNMLKETIYRRTVFKNWQKFNTQFRDMHNKKKARKRSYTHIGTHTHSQDTKRGTGTLSIKYAGLLNNVSLESAECFPDLPCPMMQH